MLATKSSYFRVSLKFFTLIVLLKADLFFLENIIDPDQLVLDETIWSGSTLFSILINNTCLELECYRLTC